MEHNAEVVAEGDQFRARCSCGWATHRTNHRRDTAQMHVDGHMEWVLNPQEAEDDPS